MTQHLKQSIILCIFLILSTAAHAADVCGDNTCGNTENDYWCSADCGGSCGDSKCARDESFSLCSECSCTETAEEELGRLINEYRAKKNLPAIPIGVHMTTVARAHARDTAVSSPTGGGCNLHSWSSNTFDGLDFSSCCYTSDHAKASCMWDKPKELTPLTDLGFEISAVGYSNQVAALAGWKSSSGHNNVITNQDTWARRTWKSMGVGIDEEKKIYHVWFYSSTDDTAKESDCRGAPTAPSAAPSASPKVNPSACGSETFLRISVVERKKKPTIYIQRTTLWEGELDQITSPATMINLPGIATSILNPKATKAMLKFEMCGKQKLILKYYKANATDSKRKSTKKIKAKNGLTYDDLEKTIKKIFGKKKSKQKWIASYMRMEVWVNKAETETQTATFRVNASA